MTTVPVPPSAVAVLPVGPGRWARLGSRRSVGRNRRWHDGGGSGDARLDPRDSGHDRAAGAGGAAGGAADRGERPPAEGGPRDHGDERRELCALSADRSAETGALGAAGEVVADPSRGGAATAAREL